MKSLNPRVNMPYLMAWFVIHYLNLMTSPHKGINRPSFIERYEFSSWSKYYTFVIRRRCATIKTITSISISWTSLVVTMVRSLGTPVGLITILLFPLVVLGGWSISGEGICYIGNDRFLILSHTLPANLPSSLADCNSMLAIPIHCWDVERNCLRVPEGGTILLQDALELILPCHSRLPTCTPLLSFVLGITMSTLRPPINHSTNPTWSRLRHSILKEKARRWSEYEAWMSFLLLIMMILLG